MADSMELIHYQNELFRVYDQLDFLRNPIFKNAEML